MNQMIQFIFTLFNVLAFEFIYLERVKYIEINILINS